MKLTTFSTAKKTKNETKQMRDSESTSKIKVRLPWTFFKIGIVAYVSSYLHLKSFAWKRGCTTFSKTKNATKLAKPILKSCYKVLLGTI